MNQRLATLCLLTTILFPILSLAQTQTENYIHTNTYRSETQSSNPTLANTTVMYYDGLGRPIQTVAAKAGGNGQDIITPVIYDGFGRESKKYLPYAQGTQSSSTLDYRPNPALINDINQYYAAKYPEDTSDLNADNPFSETVFEASPLNRVLQQAAPGHNWSVAEGRTIKFVYSTNKANEVRLFNIIFPYLSNTEITDLGVNGFYEPGQLYKTITKDENWTAADNYNKTTQEFKDKEGRVVLKRTFNNQQPHDTYYVYDRYGNLAYVIPPLASEQIVLGGGQPINYAARNYPWVNLVDVDDKFAEEYNRLLLDYENEDILNIDLQNHYGAYGGFTITPGQNGELALTLNFTTQTRLPFKRGVLVRLDDFGIFKDRELGRISGQEYEYIFSIQDNAIIVDGGGNVPSINETLGDTGQKLSYSKGYPWTGFCKTDTTTREAFESETAHMDPAAILTAQVPNDYNASGGIKIDIDEDDTITVELLLDSPDHNFEIDHEAIIPLDINRRLRDTIIGEVNGYKIQLKDNALYFKGDGSLTTMHDVWQVHLTVPPFINRPVIEGLCYIYRYDDRNRVVEKQIPGKGWIYIVYDKLDRPVLTQDENLGRKNEWLFTKYDPLGRVAYTGKFTYVPPVTPREGQDERIARRVFAQQMVYANDHVYEMQTTNSFPAGNVEINYTNDIFPNNTFSYLSNLEVLTASYYDNYTIAPSGTTETLPASNVYGISLSTATRSLPTASLVRVLETDDWIFTMTGYDHKGRAIWTKSVNSYLQTDDVSHMRLDFTGQILESTAVHNKTGITTNLITVNRFTYDNVGRLLKQTSKINNNPEELIVWNSYDELGQLISKKVGNTPGSSYTSTPKLQEVNYTYNIRGWLKGINDSHNSLTDDLFSFALTYDTGDHPLYNGNISATRWKSKSDNRERSYAYQYDGLNRLTNADYTSNFQLALNGETENYSERDIRYDKNGNITHLERRGLTDSGLHIDIIDALEYLYEPSSNRLKQVTDAGDGAGFKDMNNQEGVDYAYDLNGNMVSDVNKEIESIIYNHLNLPTKIIFKGGDPLTSQNPKVIYYIYDATGAKLEKMVRRRPAAGQPITSTTTQYAGGYMYENNKLQYFPHAEGYITPQLSHGNPTGNFDYIYQYKDHLGNIRLSYGDADRNGTISQNEIVSENNYYAFGLQHKGYNNVTAGGNAVAKKKMYNGKELQDELGLNWYDYQARNYDTALGRWMNIDPLAEVSRRWSTYTYCYNNPIRFVDPDGMQGEDWVKKGNQWSYKAEIKTADQAKAAGYDGFASNGSVIYGKGNGEMGYYTLLNDGYGRTSTKEEIAAANGKDNYGTEKTKENAVRSNVLEPSVSKVAEVAGNVTATTELVRDSKVGTMLRGGQEAAQSVTKGLKIGGAVMGAISIGATLYEYQQGNISGVEATVDVIMGGVGFLGPVGAGASLIYSLGKATYEYTTGETLFEKPSQEVPTSPTLLKI